MSYSCWPPRLAPFGSPESPQFGTRLPHHRETHIHPHRVHPHQHRARAIIPREHPYDFFLALRHTVLSSREPPSDASPQARSLRCQPENAPATRWRPRSLSRLRVHCRHCATCGNSPTLRNTSACLAMPSRSTRTSTSRYVLVCAEFHLGCAAFNAGGSIADMNTGAGERVPKATGIGEACTDRIGVAEARLVAQGPDV